MKMKAEWTDRLGHWITTLEKDFYTPLGEIDFMGFTTLEHLTPAAAGQHSFEPMPEGAVWGHEWEYAWLRANIQIPPQANGKMVVMDLNMGGEATLFVNGTEFGTRRAQWVTVPHHSIQDNILAENGRAGDRYSLLCEVYAGHFFPSSSFDGCAVGPILPGSYTDPLANKLRTSVGKSSFGTWNEDAYQLWMDVRTLQEIMECLPSGSLRAAKVAQALQQFTLIVDFEQPVDKRISDYKQAREQLRSVMDCKNGSTSPTFYAIGNAHLDVAWLWPLAETERKVARTFAAQLRMIEKYPDYRFLQSQPQTYKYCQTHYPALFEKIKAAIKKGGWIAEGAMWVEPDTNMSSGESLVRQMIHGMRYFKEELGVDCELLWLPDTFGYTAALPQILKSCGIKYLVTQKIFWSYNEGEQFPYHYFTWQGMDGSEIVSYLPTSYTYTTNPKQLTDVWDNRVQKDSMDKFLLPFGYGDGGGGPCRDYIEFAVREDNIEGCPKVKMAHPSKIFEDLEAEGGPENTYVGELYFTAHRGVYTTQAAVKWGNRKAELALREGELWGTVAMHMGLAYPSDEMDKAWKNVLLNQFHDILPGSSIARVYDEALLLHKESIAVGNELTSAATHKLAGNGDSLLAFNSLSWEREAVIALPNGGYTKVTLPSCGYTAVTATTLDATEMVHVTVTPNGALLENRKVKAVFDADGELTSFILKSNDMDFAAGGMNRFLLYKDVPRTFDAWDIDSMYEQQFIESGSNTQITLLENDPHRCAIEISKTIGNSTIRQSVSLVAGSDRVEFDTIVEWHELHRLLKVSFPVAVTSTEGINEIQYGYIKRPTHRSRTYDKDRFEVCNHRYTALCDEGHGAAVLNDCKYGVSMLGNAINLTLLRAAGSPELASDNGTQRFTYAFTAWNGSFLASPVVRHGYELNVPVVLSSGNAGCASFFAVDGGESVIIDTVKPAEDGSGDIVLRLYESKHTSVACNLRWDLPVAIKSVAICNMLESTESEQPLAIKNNCVSLHLRAFEVQTLRLSAK